MEKVGDFSGQAVVVHGHELAVRSPSVGNTAGEQIMADIQILQDRGLEAPGQGAGHRRIDMDLEVLQLFHVSENVGQRGHAGALEGYPFQAGQLAERIRQRSRHARFVHDVEFGKHIAEIPDAIRNRPVDSEPLDPDLDGFGIGIEREAGPFFPRSPGTIRPCLGAPGFIDAIHDFQGFALPASFFLFEGQDDGIDLAVLVLDGDLPGAGFGRLVFGDREFQFPARERSRLDERDPGLGGAFHFDGEIGVVLDVDGKGSALGRNLVHGSHLDGGLGFLLHGDGSGQAFALESDRAVRFVPGTRSGGRNGHGSIPFAGSGGHGDALAVGAGRPVIVCGDLDGLGAAGLGEGQAGRADFQDRIDGGGRCGFWFVLGLAGLHQQECQTEKKVKGSFHS